MLKLYASGKNTEQRGIFSFYSLFHFLFGFIWYWITYGILKDKTKTETETQKEYAISFLVLVVVHNGFELFENIPVGINLFNKIGYREYGGDSVGNSLGDLFSTSVGFWIAYSIGNSI